MIIQIQQIQMLGSPYNSDEYVQEVIHNNMIDELIRKIKNIYPENLISTQDDGVIRLHKLTVSIQTAKEVDN